MIASLFVLSLVEPALLGEVPLRRTVRVNSSAATVCIWRPAAPEPRLCSPCQDRECRLDVPADWRDDFVGEITAEGFFPAPLVSQGGLGWPSETRLDPLPIFDWRGWRPREGDPTDFEWLPDSDRASWTPLDRGPGTLPGASRALRMTPRRQGCSPVTVFLRSPRGPLGSVGPLDLKAGGEVAWCLEYESTRLPVAEAEFRIELPDGKTRHGRSGPLGCVALSYLPPGLVTIEASPPALAWPTPMTVRITAGGSLWLGTFRIPDPATLTIGVNDPDDTHRYGTTVESLFPEEGSRSLHAAEISRVHPNTLRLGPGDYLVRVTPLFLESSDLTERVSLEPGSSATIDFSPAYVRVHGSVTKGGTPAPGLPLSFSRRSRAGRDLRVRARSDATGHYTTVLQEPGQWIVNTPEEREIHWQPWPLPAEVPPGGDCTLDLDFPDGWLMGRVFEEESGRGVDQILVDVLIERSEEGRAWISVWTDADGKFQVRSLPETTVQVSVDRNVAASRGFRASGPSSAVLTAASPALVEIPLRKTRRERALRLVDAAGSPIPAAQVFLASTSPMPELLAQTDANGLAKLPEGLPPGTPLFLVSVGHPWTQAQVPDSGEEARTVRVADPQIRATRLLLQGATGAPPADLAWGLREPSGLEVPLFFHLLRQGSLPLISGGSALLPQPAPGTYEVWIRASSGTVVSLGTIALPSESPVILRLAD